MAAKRIIFGDSEIRVPEKLLTLGILPIFGIALIFWLFTGVYTVGPDEVGVVQRFGKYDRTVQSGLNYHMPFPIETVKTPKVTEVKRIEVGFRTVGKNQYRTVERESLMLTGDENIVDAELIVQYKIKEPINYLFNFKSKIVLLQGKTIEEKIEDAKKQGLSYLVVTSNSSDDVFLEVYNNEKKYEYLEKILDSRENEFRFEVKIFKINFDRFET